MLLIMPWRVFCVFPEKSRTGSHQCDSSLWCQYLSMQCKNDLSYNIDQISRVSHFVVREDDSQCYLLTQTILFGSLETLLLSPIHWLWTFVNVTVGTRSCRITQFAYVSPPLLAVLKSLIDVFLSQLTVSLLELSYHCISAALLFSAL